MKAILVIDDMPMDCGACMFGACDEDDFESTHIRCYAHRYAVGDESADMFSKPSWCPLKPLPPKLDENDWHRMFSGLFSEREAKGYGWNACLKEITDE